MTFEIYPVAGTGVDWKIYSDQVKKILNIDPLKGLGAAFINRESPSAYLATLDLENQPLKQLREGVLTNSSYHHVSVSFIGSIDSELLFNFLCEFPSISALTKEASRNQHFIIFTATLFIWHHTVRSALSHQKNYSKDLRSLFHLLLIHFEQMGFKEVWSKYQRKVLPNGSLVFT